MFVQLECKRPISADAESFLMTLLRSLRKRVERKVSDLSSGPDVKVGRVRR